MELLRAPVAKASAMRGSREHPVGPKHLVHGRISLKRWGRDGGNPVSSVCVAEFKSPPLPIINPWKTQKVSVLLYTDYWI